MIEIRSPGELPPLKHPSIFLGGAIDNGKTINWQQLAYIEYSKVPREMIFINPRRENWSAQADEQQVRAQIVWEEKGLAVADSIFIYFEPRSQAPISLLEMGLWASSGKLVVCCPKKYWRSTNVHVTAESRNVPIYTNFDEALEAAVSLAFLRFKG